MAETATVKQENATEGATQDTRTFTQDDVNAIVENRLRKESAKYSDYEELKAKASKLDEIEEASKSELQKAMEKANALQTQLDSLNKANELRDLRDKVALETGVPSNLLSGDTEETCMEQAKAILAFKQADNNNYPVVKDGGEVVTTAPKKSVEEQFGDWFNASTN